MIYHPSLTPPAFLPPDATELWDTEQHNQQSSRVDRATADEVPWKAPFQEEKVTQLWRFSHLKAYVAYFLLA